MYLDLLKSVWDFTTTVVTLDCLLCSFPALLFACSDALAELLLDRLLARRSQRSKYCTVQTTTFVASRLTQNPADCFACWLVGFFVGLLD